MSDAYHDGGGLLGKVQRRLVRYAARTPAPIRGERPTVSITFDDFPRSAADEGAAILEAAGFRGTYYCAAGFAGQENHLGALFEPSDLLGLAERGHEIGCHTYSHLDCAEASTAQIENELARNAQAIAAMGHGAPLRSFAFPFGQSSLAAKRYLTPRFDTLRSVAPGLNQRTVDCGYVLAVGLDGGEFGVKRALRLLERAQKTGGWLVLYLHDVRENPSEWGARPSELYRVVDAVTASGAAVKTMGEAARDILARAA